jgi:8-oxo-dGTP pyrophosphatase MutT (NUDIX family)
MPPSFSKLTPPTTEVARAVIRNESGAVLLLRRSPGDTNRPGWLEIAGGKHDVLPATNQLESFETALRREVAEETGLRVVHVPTPTEIVHRPMEARPGSPYNGGLYIVRAALVAVAPPTNLLMLTEHDQALWALPHELPSLHREITPETVQALGTFGLLPVDAPAA